mmetsp:Transcript_10409/g.18843  ORF Transcript_10409/g.18843 Transcript_10409/m.18843 type:complete len:155 (+) Transcript_10409:87-551(+)
MPTANKFLRPLLLLSSLPPAWLLYDYQTQHPMRAHLPFSYSQSLTRLKNMTTNSSEGYTLKRLRSYDSNNPKSIKFAVKDIVYDVTDSDSFQRKGPYEMFSGRDSTYCLAKMSMSPHDVGKDTSGSLTEKEIEDLNGWIKYFDEKYERCGVIIE